VQAGDEAKRLRLALFLMTFSLGVLPLITVTGAGAEMRSVIDVAMISSRSA
jgi:multidrug efflux pump